MAGRLTSGSSHKGAMVSSVMYRARCTAHSSFCSKRIAPTRRVMAASSRSLAAALPPSYTITPTRPLVASTSAAGVSPARDVSAVTEAG
jgi:hypothetical protein